MAISTKICPPFQVRQMTEDDFKQVVNLWTELDIAVYKSLMPTFYSIDPNGFYVAVNLEDDKVIGGIGSCNSYSDSLIVGMFAVKKEYRGLGIGSKLFEAVLKHIGDRNAGLFCNAKILPMYRDKFDFVKQDNNNAVNYAIEDSPNLDLLCKHLSGVTIHSFNEGLLSKIADFHEKITKDRNEKLLRLILSDKDGISRVIIDSKGDVVAFGTLKSTNLSTVVANGPIYSINDELAELLLYNLIKDFEPTKGLELDLRDSENVEKIAVKLNLRPIVKFYRPFTKYVPETDMSKIYGFHTVAFYPF